MRPAFCIESMRVARVTCPAMRSVSLTGEHIRLIFDVVNVLVVWQVARGKRQAAGSVASPLMYDNGVCISACNFDRRLSTLHWPK